jgi:uncharacterized MAPEG superfamily protein
MSGAHRGLGALTLTYTALFVLDALAGAGHLRAFLWTGGLLVAAGLLLTRNVRDPDPIPHEDSGTIATKKAQ